MNETCKTIAEMQKRFTVLVNKLDGISKTIPNEEVTNKVLRCLKREWKSKYNNYYRSIWKSKRT